MEVDTDDLVSSEDVAELLGLASRREVSVYRSRYPDFPEPVLQRPRCVFWLRRDIETWAKNTGRLA